jgi:L-fuculose-phosphate aldolase
VNDERARAELAAYCTRLWDRRLVTGTSGNASVKLDDGDVLVTPASRSLAALALSELVRVGPDGQRRDASQRPTSELPLHLAAYRARADARCVVHTHPTFCVVWSLSGRVFPQETVGARETLGPVAWTPFRPNGTAELAEVCRQAFAQGFNTVLMERHGLSTIGPQLETAFLLTDLAEEAARVAYFADLHERR